MGQARNFVVGESKMVIKGQAEVWASYEADRRENPSGSYHGDMTFVSDMIFDSEKEAVEWLNNKSDRTRRDWAVKFYERKTVDMGDIFTDIKNQLDKCHESNMTILEKNGIHSRKSNFVSCKNCSSKLNREYIVKKNPITGFDKMYNLVRANKCPVCSAFLISDTVVNRIEKNNDKIRELEDKREATTTQSRLGEKTGKTLWIAVVNVHN